MKYRVGVDIGGTNIRVGKIDENGQVVELNVRPSHGLDDDFDLCKILFEMLDEIDMTDVLGIGLGIAGGVDSVNKKLGEATNLKNTKDLPIGNILEDRYHIRIELDNDANVAGLAEAMYGSGKGQNMVYYITHSTGIGAALVLDGNVIKGKNFDAGEIGSYVLDLEPKRRMERSNAGPAILERAKEVLGDKVNSTKEVFELYKQNDPMAVEVVEKTFKEFAAMLANITFILNPDCFVIGGGVSKNFNTYYPIMKKYFDYYTWGELRDTPILLASLEEPGVIGAACLIK